MHQQLPSLRRLVEESGSSLVAPYFFGSSPSLSAFADQLRPYSAARVASAAELSVRRPPHATPYAAQALLARESRVADNGRADVVLATLDVASQGAASVDSAVAALTKALAERTTNYVVLMVAPEAAVATGVYVAAAAEAELDVASVRYVRSDVVRDDGDAPSNGSRTGYNTFFLPDINAAIIVSVLLLIILSVARTPSPSPCFSAGSPGTSVRHLHAADSRALRGCRGEEAYRTPRIINYMYSTFAALAVRKNFRCSQKRLLTYEMCRHCTTSPSTPCAAAEWTPLKQTIISASARIAIAVQDDAGRATHRVRAGNGERRQLGRASRSHAAGLIRPHPARSEALLAAARTRPLVPSRAARPSAGPARPTRT